jgi:hypothetical protein
MEDLTCVSPTHRFMQEHFYFGGFTSSRIEFLISHKIPHCIRNDKIILSILIPFLTSIPFVISTPFVISSNARNPVKSRPSRASFVEMTKQANKKSHFHSSLKSLHSGFMVSTRLFFFSRRHFFISFSLAIAS